MYLRELPRTWQGRTLDYGGGNGALSRRIVSLFPASTATCYEPSSTIRAEAIQANSGGAVRIIDSTAGLDCFDVIFCCEVLEHLPAEATGLCLADLFRLCAADGYVILGVPNEIFAVGLVKGIFRMTRRCGAYDASWATIGAAARGRPRLDRPVLDLDGLPFIYPHTGFDFRRLTADVRAAGFRIEKTYGSPFRRTSLHLNSEAYFVLRPDGSPAS